MSTATPEVATVMGPESSSVSFSGASVTSPPKFVSNVTAKTKYRDSLRRWMRMLTQFAKVDSKSKAILEGAGHLIYLSCDTLSQELLNQAEKSGELVLDGQQDDVSRNKMVEKILNTIAKDTPTEKVKREVDLLTEIQSCQRTSDESPSTFAVRFSSAVAAYANQTVELNENTSRQFAVLMLRNANLSPDTLNSLLFQLTTNITRRPRQHTARVELTKQELDAMLCDAAGVTSSDGKTAQEKMTVARKAITKIEQDSSPVFTLDDARASLSQVIGDKATVKTSMLGRRSMAGGDRFGHIKKMKSESTCRACGKVGHWYRDNEECRRVIRERRQNAQRERPVPDQAPPKVDENKDEQVFP